MAGTVVATENTIPSVKQIHWAWTSSAGGAADDTTTAVFDGDIIGLATDPDATAPTADYDVAVTDSNGLDVLMGQGTDRSATAIEYVSGTSLGAVSNSTLTLAVTAAGNAKAGVVVLWIR